MYNYDFQDLFNPKYFKNIICYFMIVNFITAYSIKSTKTFICRVATRLGKIRKNFKNDKSQEKSRKNGGVLKKVRKFDKIKKSQILSV